MNLFRSNYHVFRLLISILVLQISCFVFCGLCFELTFVACTVVLAI